MRLRSFFRGGWLLRTIARELAAIKVQLARQADAWERIADHYAPPSAPPKADASSLADTGLSFLDANEQLLALGFIQRTETEQHYTPTEDEVLTYLADEKTVDLAARLRQRDQELLQRARSERGS